MVEETTTASEIKKASEIEAQGESGVAGLRGVLTFLRPYKPQVAVAATALVFTAGIMLSLGQGIRLLIDNGFASNSAEQLNQSVGLFAGLICLLAAGTFVRFYTVTWIGERVVADLRKAVFNHIIELHPGFFEQNPSAEIQSRLTTDTTLLQTVIGSSVSIALRSVLMFTGGVILLVITNPKLSGIVLASVPLVVVPIKFFGRRVKRLATTTQDKVANVGAYINETLGGIKTVQAFNHQPQDVERFGRHVETVFQVSKKNILNRSLLITVVILLVMGAVAAMLWVGGHDVLAGKISGGELASFVFYAIIVGSAVGSISEVIGELQRAAGAVKRIMQLLNAQSLITAPDTAASRFQFRDDEVGAGILFDDISFAYPSRPETNVIENLELEVKAGETLALVGPSGAGKSTLFDLALRFYDVTAGQISVQGVPVRDMQPEELRQIFAIVQQHPVLFNGTIMENIRYAETAASEEDVIEAAKAAFAHDFIMRLPQAYETRLGDDGIGLSGGQKQRIAIARAILTGPRILLLDEATSALDSESEYMVQRALDNLKSRCTTLIIAHRLATVKNANRIAVINHGKLVALGRHNELLASNDLYARLAELQFSHPDDVADEAILN